MRGPDFHIFDLTPEALQSRLEPLGMPRYRVEQVLQWVYRRHCAEVEGMTNLSRRDREVLREAGLCIESGRVVREAVAGDATRKLLVEWLQPPAEAGGAWSGSGLETECVMIPAEPRRTACLSSQVGCPVGCRFCASGLGGLDGNLSCGRIVEQAWRLDRDLSRQGERLTNVVFMGMGEPLANYQSVVDAVRALSAPWGMGIGARRITISTVGLPAAIRRLAREELQVTLALSLHAPNDEIRRGLIPWAEYATIEELLDACREYFALTGREVTLEYTLMRGVNDRREHAQELASLARRLRSHVNLIRYNEVEGLEFARPVDEDVRTFQTVLRDRGVNVHIRASRGRDIAAACGQLRHEHRGSGAVSVRVEGRSGL